MSTTKNKKIIKLQESTQKRNEAWIEVDKCVSLYRHDLPQEFVDAWGGFERLAEEVEAIEVEAINGIEQGLDRLQKSINKEKEIFGLSQRLLGKMFVFSFIVFISHLLVTYISEIPEPRPANSGFKYIPSLRLITCCCQSEMDHPYLGNGNV